MDKECFFDKETILKPIPDEYMEAIKDIAKESPHENFFGLYFETEGMHGQYPKRFTAIQGSEHQIRVPEEELDSGYTLKGHNHYEDEPMPSARDFQHLEKCNTEFIVSSTTDKAIIYHIEDKKQFDKWHEITGERVKRCRVMKKLKEVDAPLECRKFVIDPYEINKEYGHDFLEKNGYSKFGGKILKDKQGQDIFLKQTGVKVYPYKKGIKLKMRKF